MRSTTTTTAAALAAALMAAGCATMSSEHRTACDRDCLIRVTDAYLNSLVAHDASLAPLADNVVIIENIHKIQPGEGLWTAVTAPPTAFQIVVPDAEAQTVGYLGMMSAEGGPIEVAIRLKLEGGKVVEAEHLVTDPLTNEANLANLQTVRPGFRTVIPAGERLRRDELVKIGATYYDALDDNDGTLSSFAADCERHENGMITAGPGPAPSNGPIPGQGANAGGPAPTARDCAGQLSTGIFTYIDRIENRRVFAADPATGLTMGLSHFRHPMDGGPYPVTALDGSTSMREMTFDPFDLPAAHIFKIGPEGEIHEIEAMGFMAPYNSPTGWE